MFVMFSLEYIYGIFYIRHTWTNTDSSYNKIFKVFVHIIHLQTHTHTLFHRANDTHINSLDEVSRNPR